MLLRNNIPLAIYSSWMREDFTQGTWYVERVHLRQRLSSKRGCFNFLLSRGGKFSSEDGKKKGRKKDFFFFSKERKKAWNFSFFPPKKRSPKRLSFANSVSHRPRVKQKTGKEITAPFPGKIYFRESASDKVLDKVPLDGVPQKSTRASARGVEEINRLSEMKLGHWYLFLTVEV